MSSTRKAHLQSKIKSSGMGYVLFFFLGAHYAYVGKWGLQLLFWFTLGGCLIWGFIDIFRISSIVESYNFTLLAEIADIEKKERAEERADQIAMLKAVKD